MPGSIHTPRGFESRMSGGVFGPPGVVSGDMPEKFDPFRATEFRLRRSQRRLHGARTTTPNAVEPSIEARPGPHSEQNQFLTLHHVQKSIPVVREVRGPCFCGGHPPKPLDPESRSRRKRSTSQGGDDTPAAVANLLG